MKNILSLLAFLSFVNVAITQSISLQVGTRITPNPSYWAYYSPHKQLVFGIVGFYYQPKIGKKIELVTGLQLSYTQFTYQYHPIYDCITGMTKVLVKIRTKDIPITTELQLGTNICLFSTSNKKWTFWLTPSVRISGLGWTKTYIEKHYEDGSAETFTYRFKSTASASENYATLGGQIGQESRFHFAPHFFASGKIWGGYEYTLLNENDRHGVAFGLQFGMGYKWK